MTAPPNVECPEESGRYKAVQVTLDGVPYLRLRLQAEGAQHAGMLRDFLAAAGVDYATEESRGVGKIPARIGERYSVDGMGWADVDTKKRTAVFYGLSSDYGLVISAEHIERIRPHAGGWTLSHDPDRRPYDPPRR